MDVTVSLLLNITQNVNVLLLADDLVLFGDNIGHLQKLCNISVFCEKWGLSVNMSKTKFMVFRNGGIIQRNEKKVYCDGKLIDTGSYYKYLGVFMSSRLNWSPAKNILAYQAGNSMNVIRI